MAGIPKGGYGIIGRAAMRSDKVSKEAKAVYALICSYTGDADFCFPSMETMAADLKCSVPSIKRYVAELVANDFIKKGKKIESGKGAHNRVNAYWPQFIEPENKQQITSDPLQQLASDPIKELASDPLLLTSNTNKNNKISEASASPLVEPEQSLYRKAIDLIGRAHKHLTGDDLVWKGREGRYGKAMKQILEIVSRETPEVAFDMIRQKCAAYVAAAQTDKYLKGQGVTPVSIFDSWNKVHYKPNMLRGAFGAVKKEFPKYREMTAEQIKESLQKWNKHFTVLEIQPHISPESYLRFTREANGYAPALVDILIEEVHPEKKTA